MSDVTSTTSRGPSRRAVVRTAANAAWAVPAIQIAVAAPAFAASKTDELQIVGVPAVTRTGPDTKSGHFTYTVSGIRVWNDGGPGGNLAAGLLIITFTGQGPSAQTSVFVPGKATTTGAFAASMTGTGNLKASAQYTSTAGANEVPVGPSGGTAIGGTFTFDTPVALTSLTVSAAGGSFAAGAKSLAIPTQ